MHKFDLFDAHQVWMDGHLIPQTPEKITFEHEDRTTVDTMVNGDSLTIGHRDGPTIISFDFKDTIQEYPWTWEKAERQHWSDMFWQWKLGQYAFQFDIIRYYTHGVSMKVLLTDWSFSEDANDNSDFTYSVKLMEYCPQVNQEINADMQHHLIQNRTAQGWRAGGR